MSKAAVSKVVEGIEGDVEVNVEVNVVDNNREASTGTAPSPTTSATGRSRHTFATDVVKTITVHNVLHKIKRAINAARSDTMATSVEVPGLKANLNRDNRAHEVDKVDNEVVAKLTQLRQGPTHRELQLGRSKRYRQLKCHPK